MQPSDRDGVAARSDTKNEFRVEIIYEAVCISSIDASKALGTVLVLGAAKHETDVQCKSMSHSGCNKTSIMTTSGLLHLGDLTIRTLFNRLGMLDLRDALVDLEKAQGGQD
jgi:hypothetical protein